MKSGRRIAENARDLQNAMAFEIETTEKRKRERTIDLCEVFRIRIVMFVESRE